MKSKTSAKYYDLLAEFGYDASKCLSLTVSIDKDIAEKKTVKDDKGRIIYSNVLNKILAGEEIPEDIKMSFFGENSQFFGRIMNDGNIFNPYIHRRFLPSQYIRIFRMGTRILRERTYEFPLTIPLDYVYDFLETEAKKITLLKETDYIAYSQRSACVTLSDAKDILKEVLQNVRTNHWERLVYKPSGNTLTLNVERWNEYKERAINKIIKATSYDELLPIISDMRNQIVSYGKIHQYLFMNGMTSTFSYIYCFAGVYFTLTSLLSFGKANGADYIIPDSFPCSKASDMVKFLRKETLEAKDMGMEKKKELYQKYNNYLFDFLSLNRM